MLPRPATSPSSQGFGAARSTISAARKISDPVIITRILTSTARRALWLVPRLESTIGTNLPTFMPTTIGIAMPIVI